MSKLPEAVSVLAIIPLFVWHAAIAQGFGAPATLAQGMLLIYSDTAMDAAGDAVVVWADETPQGAFTAQASYRPAGGQWAASVTISTLSSIFPPVVHFAPNGGATAVSANAGGTWAVDMAPGGQWGSPYLVAMSGGPSDFVTDNAGNAAIVYSPTSTYELGAVRRAAGGNWSAPENVVTLAQDDYLNLDGAALGPAGDLVVSWEEYILVCNRPCEPTDYEVFASREKHAGAGWVQAGPFIGPLAGPALSVPALDKQHIATVVFGAPGTTSPIMSVTQGKTGSWGATAKVFSDVTPNYPAVMGLEVSGPGHAAVGLLQQNGPGEISVIDGALAKNHWGRSVDVSQSDNQFLDSRPYGAQTFGANASGGLAIGWADSGGAIRVIARQKSGGPWGALQTAAPGSCAGGGNCTAATATAITNAGAEIVTWTVQAPNGTFALDVATTD